MTDVVNVVVTCTKDKRQPVADECQLRNVPGASIRERIQECRLAPTVTGRNPCESRTYMPATIGQTSGLESSYFAIDVWVCSAGYGLIHFDDYVAPYAATFSRSHPDSVASQLPESDRLSAAQNWWSATASKWKTHFGDRPRSLTDLMAEYPKRSLLVVASDTYMRAIADDLRDGVSHLEESDQLAIVCAGVKSLEGLDQNLVPCDARMQTALGGARRSFEYSIGRQDHP